MSVALSLGSLARSLAALVLLLLVGIALASALGSGIAFLGVALWTAALGLTAAGVLLAMRDRLVAGIGAIVSAVAVLLAFFWLDQPSPLVWTVLFFVGIGLIVRGTAEDTVRRDAWVLLLPRVVIGWALLDNAQDHFRSNWLPAVQGTGYFATASGAASRPPAYFLDPLYQAFLKGVIVPGVDTWAGLTIVGEMSFGLLLAVGLFTPVAALGAMWLHFNYFNMKSFTSHGGYPDKVFFVLELFNLITCAGLVYGLDASLRRLVPAVVAETLMGVAPEAVEESVMRPQARPI